MRDYVSEFVTKVVGTKNYYEFTSMGNQVMISRSADMSGSLSIFKCLPIKCRKSLVENFEEIDSEVRSNDVTEYPIESFFLGASNKGYLEFKPYMTPIMLRPILVLSWETYLSYDEQIGFILSSTPECKGDLFRPTLTLRKVRTLAAQHNWSDKNVGTFWLMNLMEVCCSNKTIQKVLETNVSLLDSYVDKVCETYWHPKEVYHVSDLSELLSYNTMWLDDEVEVYAIENRYDEVCVEFDITKNLKMELSYFDMSHLSDAHKFFEIPIDEFDVTSYSEEEYKALKRLFVQMSLLCCDIYTDEYRCSRKGKNNSLNHQPKYIDVYFDALCRIKYPSHEEQ